MCYVTTWRKDVANKLKQQVSTLRDLSHRKQNLQNKIDATKKAFKSYLMR